MEVEQGTKAKNGKGEKSSALKGLSETLQKKTVEILEKEDEKAVYEIGDIKKYFYHDYEAKVDKIEFINRTGNYSCRADKKVLPWYILMPNGKFRNIWDLFIFTLSMYVLVIAPVDIAFNLECVFPDNGMGKGIIYLLASAVQIVDMIFNLFTARLDERMEFVFCLKANTSMYIKDELFFDLVNTVPWYSIVAFNIHNCFTDGVDSSKTYYILYFFYITKLSKGLNVFDDLLAKHAILFKFVKLMFMLLYVTHVTGVIFCGVSPSIYLNFLRGCGTTDCVNKMYTTNFLNIYTYSWYIGMLFFGGNDVAIQRNWEMYYLLIINALSMIVTAMLFGYLTEIVSEIGTSGLTPILQQKLDVMNEYMRFKGFESGFFTVIEEYLNNLWLKQRNIIYEDTFFDDLSYSLHKLLLIEQWQYNFFMVSKLVKLTSIDFFTAMIPMLKPKIFMSKDIIVSEGNIDSDVFFNSRNGFCSMQIGGNLVKFLGPWEYFGEIAIFLRMKRRTATITCLKDCDFLFLESKNFEKLLMDFPEDALLIGKKAKEDLMSSMKLYPSSMFAKLVPTKAKKDYLTRKSIYLNEREEETMFFTTKTETKVNLNHFKSSMDQIETMIFDMKSRLVNRIEVLEATKEGKKEMKR